MPITAVVLASRAAITSSRPWIAEGLPQFLRVAYDEAHGGRPLAIATMRNFRAPLADAEKTPAQNNPENRVPHPSPDQNNPQTGVPHPSPKERVGTNAEKQQQSTQPTAPQEDTAIPDPLVLSTDPIMYRFKAMYVWWMLRDMVGEDTLKRALRAYRVTEDKQPAYFQHLLRQVSPRDLEWFFDDWVYRDRGLPDFRIDSAFSRTLLNANGQAQGATVTVTIENLGDAGAEVPVMVRTSAGAEVAQRVEVRAKAKAVTRITVPAEPEEIIVNDGSVPETNITNNTYKLIQPTSIPPSPPR
jgi:hypothetical protein